MFSLLNWRRLQGVLHTGPYFEDFVIFSKNKATLDKVSNGLNKKCSIDHVDEVQINLKKARENAKKELDITAAKFRSKLLKSLGDERPKISDEIGKIGCQHESRIKMDKNSLESQRFTA